MPLIPIEELLEQVDSKYRLVMIAANRSKQLNKGASPMIQAKGRKPTYIALEEIAQGALKYELSPAEEERVKGLAAEELVKPTWFRDLAPEAALVEGGIEEEEELEEEEEYEEEEELEEEGPEVVEEKTGLGEEGAEEETEEEE
ncbi:MAG: DNA-directed RNA polymerase subunit omega [candidate division NC10 bacterium]|nr:DNA-directed RNA polymerase subunit omega [candidate division NC10 bacterium]